MRNSFGQKAMYLWLVWWANIPRQVACSIVLATVTTGILIYATSGASSFTLGTALVMWLTFFLGTQLPYWSYAIIDAFNTLASDGLQVTGLDPSNSDVIHLLKRQISSVLGYGAVAVLLFLLVTYLLFLQDLAFENIRIAFLVWYAFAVVTAIALFWMPNHYMSKIIALHKRHIMDKLQRRMLELLKSSTEGVGRDVEILEKTMSLYLVVKATPDSSLTWDSLRGLMGSILLQSIPLLTLLDWRSLQIFLGKSIFGP